MFYVDIIVPLPLAGFFTYASSQPIEAGCRVIVQFGKKKFYSAVVWQCYEPTEQKEGIKEITSILDHSPIVFKEQLQLWEWISDYYMCHLGEVLKAALPSALKLESETRISLMPDAFPKERLTPSETKIFDLLSDKKVYSVSQVEKQTGITNSFPIVRSLLDKELITVDEYLGATFKPKSETVVRLFQKTEKELNTCLDSLSRAPKQRKLLETFLEQMGDCTNFCLPAKKLLHLSQSTSSILKSLVDKNIFLQEERELAALTMEDIYTEKQLNEAQQQAFSEINKSFQTKNITLLHGVTSSGKTEIYIKLIAEQLKAGKQVLYLLPEIALTTQITTRLKAVFGEQLGIYHSKFTDNERAEVWNNLVKEKSYRIIVGVRSSVFLPFRNLGLVIVDEEHEGSYKQHNPAPRYHGRNTAIMLAYIHQAKTLLGTATPAVETYYNALSGKYGLVELKHRYEGLEMPEIHVVNTKELRRKKIMKSPVFSPDLLNKMSEAFQRGEQVILFRNRRGFAPYMECKNCGWTPKCHHCDVSLTYHKYQNALTCHYCGATYPIQTDCPSCGEKNSVSVVGFGTERLEEEIAEHFPDKRIARMDLDTTRSKKSYDTILNNFANGKTDILIGTQMVSKGLDFENVSLVGVIQADSLLNQPDFRANERAFQMLEQVSGRAGRKNKQGLVVLQTTNPDNRIVRSVCAHDYFRFYQSEIKERELFNYPPFYRISHVVLRSKDKDRLIQASNYLADLLRKSFGNRIFGPIEPVVSRIQTLYIRRIILKTEMAASPNLVRKQLHSCLSFFFSQPISKSILIYPDVDPM